jgi:hypothetical protein
MQLRVARLCLDCEELHTENRCPRCISEHYAMLTMWLPVEERRRFRRPSRSAAARRPGLLGMVDAVVRWINGGEVVDPPPGWATRREDFAARELRGRADTRPLVDTHSTHSRVPAAGSD